MGLFDRFFIDWYWVEHTKAWNIPNTEDLKPYIPKKMKIVKWVGTIVGFGIISLLVAIRDEQNCLINSSFWARERRKRKDWGRIPVGKQGTLF